MNTNNYAEDLNERPVKKARVELDMDGALGTDVGKIFNPLIVEEIGRIENLLSKKIKEVNSLKIQVVEQEIRNKEEISEYFNNLESSSKVNENELKTANQQKSLLEKEVMEKDQRIEKLLLDNQTLEDKYNNLESFKNHESADMIRKLYEKMKAIVEENNRRMKEKDELIRKEKSSSEEMVSQLNKSQETIRVSEAKYETKKQRVVELEEQIKHLEDIFQSTTNGEKNLGIGEKEAESMRLKISELEAKNLEKNKNLEKMEVKLKTAELKGNKLVKVVKNLEDKINTQEEQEKKRIQDNEKKMEENKNKEIEEFKLKYSEGVRNMKEKLLTENETLKEELFNEKKLHLEDSIQEYKEIKESLEQMPQKYRRKTLKRIYKDQVNHEEENNTSECVPDKNFEAKTPNNVSDEDPEKDLESLIFATSKTLEHLTKNLPRVPDKEVSLPQTPQSKKENKFGTISSNKTTIKKREGEENNFGNISNNQQGGSVSVAVVKPFSADPAPKTDGSLKTRLLSPSDSVAEFLASGQEQVAHNLEQELLGFVKENVTALVSAGTLNVSTNEQEKVERKFYDHFKKKYVSDNEIPCLSPVQSREISETITRYATVVGRKNRP